MPNNVTLPGSGAVIAADDIDGIQYQRMKVCQGEEGKAVDVSESNPLNVKIIGLLEIIVQALRNPPYLDKSANAIRNQVQSGTVTTVSTVGTVTTVTNVSVVDTYQGKLLMLGSNKDAWANTVRRTIS